MSCVNKRGPSQRSIALAGAGAVNVLIAGVLLGGLAIKYVAPEAPTEFGGEQIYLPPPPEPNETPVPQPSQATQPRQIVAPEPPSPLPRLPQFDVAPIAPADPGPLVFPTGGTGTALILPDPPTPTPSFAPSSPMPLNGPAGWIANADYPRVALTRGWEGMTNYRLAIGVDGRVTSCSIVASSGHQALDEAACRFIQRRARFEPAVDGSGRDVAGSFFGAVTWQIPR